VLARRLILVAGLAVVGCGSEPMASATHGVDGVYRMTVSASDLVSIGAPGESAGRWTLILSRRRFAITQERETSCTWAYGGLARHGQRLDLRVIDAGGASADARANPGDDYGARWSLYRDVLTLSALRDTASGPLALKPWRRAAVAPTVASLSRRCRPPQPALTPTGVENVAATGATMNFIGDFARTGPTTWAGTGRSKALGPGRMTMQGDVVFRNHARSRVSFTMRFASGSMRGCAINEIFRRPHRRFVWDGPGQITATSPRLRRYLALTGRIGGVTMTYARDRAHGGFGVPPDRAGGRRPDVIC
jgi:hypothetical protein